MPGNHLQHRGDDQLGRRLEFCELIRRLDRPQPLQHQQRVLELGAGQGVGEAAVSERIAQHSVGIGRQEGRLDRNGADAVAEPLDVVDGKLHGIGAARRGSLHDRRPEPVERLLVGFEAIADIGGILRLAALVEQNGQIPAQPHGVHVVEEEEAIAAEQVLHIVLRRDEHRVDVGFAEKPIEQSGVERNCLRGRRRRIHGCSSKLHARGQASQATVHGRPQQQSSNSRSAVNRRPGKKATRRLR